MRPGGTNIVSESQEVKLDHNCLLLSSHYFSLDETGFSELTKKVRILENIPGTSTHGLELKLLGNMENDLSIMDCPGDRTELLFGDSALR